MHMITGDQSPKCSITIELSERRTTATSMINRIILREPVNLPVTSFAGFFPLVGNVTYQRWVGLERILTGFLYTASLNLS